MRPRKLLPIRRLRLPCRRRRPKNPPSSMVGSIAMAIAAFCAIGLIASYYVGGDTTKFWPEGHYQRDCGDDAGVAVHRRQCGSWECGLVVLVFYDGAVLPIGPGLS